MDGQFAFEAVSHVTKYHVTGNVLIMKYKLR